MLQRRYIRLFSVSVFSVLGAAALVYFSTDFKNPVSGKVSSLLVGEINPQTARNASVGNESSSESYFSIFNFITNLARKN